METFLGFLCANDPWLYWLGRLLVVVLVVLLILISVHPIVTLAHGRRRRGAEPIAHRVHRRHRRLKILKLDQINYSGSYLVRGRRRGRGGVVAGPERLHPLTVLTGRLLERGLSLETW